jgi:predicted HTH domain antitoxin
MSGGGGLHQASRSEAISMHVELPDDIMRRAEANVGDVLLAVAVQLYSDNRLDFVDALAVAGISSDDFSQELIKRDISINQYPPVRIGRGDSAAA